MFLNCLVGKVGNPPPATTSWTYAATTTKAGVSVQASDGASTREAVKRDFWIPRVYGFVRHGGNDTMMSWETARFGATPFKDQNIL